MIGCSMAIALVIASAPPRGSVYDVELVPDMAFWMSTFTVATLIEAEKGSWSGAPACWERPLGEGDATLCDPASVNALDRWTTAHYSPAADTASDWLLIGLLAAPFAASAGGLASSSDTEGRGTRFGEDALVTLQAYGLADLMTNVLKVAIQRPRPLTYNAEVPRGLRLSGEARLSFPSGHTSLSFAAATMLAFTTLERHGASPLSWLAAAGAYAAASAVGWLRMAAGKHFLTDVLAGAVIGTAAALIVARAHRRDLAGEGAAIQSFSGGLVWATGW